MPKATKTTTFQIVDIYTGSDSVTRVGKIGFTTCPDTGHSHSTKGGADCDSELDYDAIATWDAAALVMLGTEQELAAQKAPHFGNAVLIDSLIYHYLPTCEGGLPDPAHEDVWDQSCHELRAMVRDGFSVLIHCKARPDWAAPTAARLLAELCMAPAEAVQAVRVICPGVIDTSVQENYVYERKPLCDDVPDTSMEGIADRAVGAMLGLAMGEAEARLMVTEPRTCEPRLGGRVAASSFDLGVFHWSSGTAMALALMDSLLVHPGLNVTDLMERFTQWHEVGHYSCTGACYDIGKATRAALQRYAKSGNPLAGSSDPLTAGNGSLIRLAPVAIRYWNDRPRLRELAALQSRVTHAAPVAVDACVAFAEVLADAISGRPRRDVMRPRTGAFEPHVGHVMSGCWRGMPADRIMSSNSAAESLEAAMWGVGRTGTYFNAIAMAVGSDEAEQAGISGAVVGQLVGALYGASAFSWHTADRLAWNHRITSTARALFEASLS